VLFAWIKFKSPRRRNHIWGTSARGAATGDSQGAGPEIAGGEGTAEESPPGRVTDETDYFRLADHTSRNVRIAKGICGW